MAGSASGSALPIDGSDLRHVEGIARTGYAAKGLVYGIVGCIAASAALGAGQATGSSGALQSLAQSDIGRVALGAIAIGLGCYVLWRLMGALLNPEADGGGKRTYLGITAIVHAALTVEAVRLVIDGGGGGASGGAESRTATLMQQPFGVWLVGAVGLAIIGYGVWQLVRAWRAELSDQLELGRMSASARPWAVRAGRFGMAARGVVFCIIGAFLVIAATRADPNEAKGLGEALRTLQQQPYGPWLLGAVALGFIAYGAYQLIEARYRRIEVA